MGTDSKVRVLAVWLNAVVLMISVLALPAQAAKVVKPGKVTSVKVSAASKSLTVSWVKGKGGNPTSYIVTLTPGNKKCTTSKTSCKFTSLVNGQKYSIGIVAKNSAGQSPKVSTTGTPSAPKPVSSPTPSNSMRRLLLTGKVSGTLTAPDGSENCDSYSIQTAQNATVDDPDCTLRLAAILANGQMFTSTAQADSKNFNIQIDSPRLAQNNLTLHLVRASGAYVGPVLVKAGGYTGITSTSTSANVTLDLGTINLNQVDVDPSGDVDNRTAFGQTASAVTFAGTLKVRLNGNAPAGAGKAGFVAAPNITKLRLHALLSGNSLGKSSVTDADPCPDLGPKGAGTLTTSCYQAILFLLSQDQKFEVLKTAFEKDCKSVAGNPKATYQWLLGTAPGCASALEQVMNQSGGGDNGGGQGGGDNGGGQGGGNNGGGQGGGSDPCDSILPGGDPDSDGIPNALDVDDNGDLIIDSADPSANNGCSIEPMKGIRTSIDRPLNFGLVEMSQGEYSASDFSTDINDYLSGPEFGIGYYVYKTGFFPDAYLTDSGEMPAVWVSCSGILWCDPKTSRALLGTNVEQTNAVGASGCNPSGFFDFSCNAPFNQSDYFGGTNGFGDSNCGNVEDQADKGHNQPCWSEIKAPMSFGSADNQNCQQNTFNPDATLPGNLVLPSDATNFFWRHTCSMAFEQGKSMIRTIMGAGISPQVGKIDGAPLAQDVLSPLNVLSLNYFNKSGNVSSVATTLGAYPITGPLLQSVNFNGQSETIDYQAMGSGLNKTLGSGGNGDNGNQPHAIVIQPGKKLTVTFYRPQRQAFPGEDATSGYHDVHGLSYGLEFELKSVQLGCGASSGNPDYGNISFDSAYDTPSSDFTINNSADSGANSLAPLRDAVIDSPTEQPGTETLSFTLDIAKCFQDRADLLKTMFNRTGSSFASGLDVLKAMELPAGAPTDGTASNWASQTGLPTNGDTTCIAMNLNGRSEAKTGGTDSSLQRICVQFAPGSLVPSLPSKNPIPQMAKQKVVYFKKD